MLTHGILNPHVLSLLARVRHTNTLVIADKGFPFWPEIETVDLSFTDDVPTVLQVLTGIRGVFTIGQAFMAEEFLAVNPEETQAEFQRAFAGVALNFEPHEGVFKKRVPRAIGLIRTGGTVHYSNVILTSA